MVSTPQIVVGDIQGDLHGKTILYVIKADQTSYINYMKPLIFALELDCPHILSVIDTRDEWFYAVHPERMVPCLKDHDPETGEDFVVFESTACLQYLATKYDVAGDWTGRNAWEKAQVLSWTAYQTAGLGATAKYWLYFLRGYPTRQNPEPMPKTCAKLHANTLRAWGLLNKRLSLPGQEYIALPDRPSIADISYLPFAMPWMFGFFGVEIERWPAIERWSRKMLGREAVGRVLEYAPGIGHGDS
ncbi:related to glutathione S-transferase GliG [Ramularia collo-cygni]|uniref:glutathione transferase n=1 Tax=Ramularia collo-cygni TaxID=112498 RepID=A0A2D3VHI9_9PEZI|nr:related to glutathione S-transferase GliG [Ramularia collo-cygni]CZT23691.1 related to glutathione S-transferase GliG [Ramularia collo-cygni]